MCKESHAQEGRQIQDLSQILPETGMTSESPVLLCARGCNTQEIEDCFSQILRNIRDCAGAGLPQ